MYTKYLLAFITVCLCIACDGGIDKTALETTPSKVYLSKSGMITYQLFDFGDEQVSYDIYINKGGYEDREAEVTLTYDTSLLERSGEDLAYTKAYPETAFNFTENKVQLNGDQTLAKTSITINMNEVRSIVSQEPDITHVIPIQLQITETPDVIINDTKDYMLLNLEIVSPVVQFAYKGLTIDNTFNPFTQTDVKTLSLPVELTLPFVNDDYDFTFTISANQELVDEYNEIHGTDYLIVPEESYTIPTMEIKAGVDNIAENINVNLDKLPVANSGQYYLLPIMISESGNEEIPIEENAICYFRIKQLSKWTGNWLNTIQTEETGIATAPGAAYQTMLYSRMDALESLTDATILSALGKITDKDAIICPGWAGTMFEQCSPIIKITDQPAENGKMKIEILAGWAGEAAAGHNTVTDNNSTYDPLTNEIYLDYKGQYDWGSFHVQRIYHNYTPFQ